VSDLTTLSALELALRDLSHDERAVEVVRQFAASLGKTKQRQQVFNAPGALVRTPLDYDEALASGTIAPTEDRFSFLQGDIVSTDAAYLLGNRLTGMKFVIASATCDLVPARREYAALLRIQPIAIDTPQAANLLGQLLKFQSTQRLYLPPLPQDPPDTLANAVLFDGIVQVELAKLLLAMRIGSLSLVGWRIFGSMIRSLMARTGDGEVRLRNQYDLPGDSHPRSFNRNI
jgi:hypothetical protein